MAEYELEQARPVIRRGMWIGTEGWGEEGHLPREITAAYFATYVMAIGRRIEPEERHHWQPYESEKPILTTLLERIMALEHEVEKLRSQQPGYTLAEPVVFTLPEGSTREQLEECKQKILSELDQTPGMYPSDFAAKHGFDLRLVLAAFSELEKAGEIELTSPGM